MSPLALEWARLWRTRRLAALVLVFVFFGFLGPVLAAYLPDLLESAAGSDDILIVVPDPVPADGIAQYVGNVSQIGLLVVAVVAALALSVNGRPGLAAFYRSRQPTATARVLTRWMATWAAAVLAWTLGLLAALYETIVLLGDISLASLVLGWLCWVVYLAVVVALVGLTAGVTGSTVAAAVSAVGLLLGVAALGLIPQVGDWLPSALVGAPEALVRGTAEAADYVPAVAVTLIATAAALTLAVAAADRRELSG